MLNRFAYQRIGCKVHYCFDLFLLHYPHEQRTICQIALDQYLFRNAFPVSAGKIVVDPNRVPKRSKQLYRMRAHVACPTDNQYLHTTIPLIVITIESIIGSLNRTILFR